MGRRPRVTSDQVYDTARRLFAERGFHEVSLAQIGAKLGISAAAVLRHAKTKEELMSKAMAPLYSDIRIPIQRLEEVNPKEDPRKVLRAVAKEFVPFLEQRFSEQIAWWIHARTAQDAQRIAGVLRNPFGTISGPTPPQRGLKLVEDYFRRISKAGHWKFRDPKAAALLFLGSLHSYVTLHRLLRILDPPMPLDRYLDSLFEIWTHGADRRRKRK
jgi:AcrR family transcriptional regulator